MAGHFDGRALEAGLKALGWDHGDLVSAVHELEAQATGKGLSFSADTVGSWTSGDRNPSVFYAARVWIVFEAAAERLGRAVTPEDIGLRHVAHKPRFAAAVAGLKATRGGRSGSVDGHHSPARVRPPTGLAIPGGGRPAAWGPPVSLSPLKSIGGDALDGDEDVKRRDFVRQVALGVGSLGLLGDRERILALLAGPGGVDARLVDDLEFMTNEHERHYWTVRPATLWPLATLHVNTLRGVVDLRPRGGLGRRAKRITSQAAALCGWLAIRLNRRADAAMYLALALELADDIDAPLLRAHSLVAMRALCSSLITDQRHAHPERALALMNEAVAYVGWDAPPLLRTEVFACRAEEFALQGRSDACLRDLDLAEQALAQARTPSGDFFNDWNEERLLHYRGTCSVLLRQPAEAMPLLEATIMGTDPAMVAPYSAALADLASACAQQDDTDRACDLLNQVLDIAQHAGMPQRVHRVRRTRLDYLARQQDTWPVRMLDERLARL